MKEIPCRGRAPVLVCVDAASGWGTPLAGRGVNLALDALLSPQYRHGKEELRRTAVLSRSTPAGSAGASGVEKICTARGYPSYLEILCDWSWLPCAGILPEKHPLLNLPCLGGGSGSVGPCNYQHFLVVEHQIHPISFLPQKAHRQAITKHVPSFLLGILLLAAVECSVGTAQNKQWYHLPLQY